MKSIDIILLIIDVIVTSFSSVLLKVAVKQTETIKKILFILIGFGIYFLMSFISVYLYSQYTLVLIQVLLTTTYIVTPILANYILKEKLSPKVWYCIIAIIVGIAMVSVGQSQL